MFCVAEGRNSLMFCVNLPKNSLMFCDLLPQATYLRPFHRPDLHRMDGGLDLLRRRVRTLQVA